MTKNPLRLFGNYAKASSVHDACDDARKDWDATRASRSATLYSSPEWWTRFLMAARNLVLAIDAPAEIKEILMMKNWKTTLSGVAAILAVVAKAFTTGAVDWQTDGPAVIAGIGLILAKDASHPA
jgi:hypothetical protein